MTRDALRAVLVLVLVAAAMVSLTRVFADDAWLVPSITAALVAVVLAAGIRALRLGALPATVVSLAGLVVFTYVSHLPPGPLLPGLEQLDQTVALLEDGLVAMQEQPAPTPVTPGLLLLVTSGVWVVAHLAHASLVRLRRPGLAIVVPGILWAAPLAVPLPPGRTWPQAIPFLAAAGIVLLLESDADVAGHTRQHIVRDASPAGIVIGAIALIVAAVAPGLLPGYQAEALVAIGGGDDPRGYQPIVDVGDRLKLPSDRDVLEVKTNRRSYFRLAALETFDGTTWKIGPAGSSEFRPDADAIHAVDRSPLPYETAIADATEVVAEVEVLDLENIYLPVPYQVVSIEGEATEDMVYSTQGGFVATAELGDNEIAGRLVPGVVEGLTYETVSALPTPTVPALREVPTPDRTDGLTELPPGTSQRYAGLANDVYAQARATTMIDRVLAVQDFFAGDDRSFTYATDVDALRGEGALERFLFETRTGYCEYFATAMAVMLRSTGIPARVAVGFLGGRLVQPADPGVGRPLDTYRISTSDAHAWVEVLFPGHGWIRFDPTPRADGAVQRPTPNDLDPELTEREQAQADAAPEEAAPSEEPSPSTSPSAPGDIPAGIDRGELQVADGTGGGGGRRRLGAILLALAALVGTVGAVAAGTWYRRPTHPSLPAPQRVLAAQRRLLHVAEGYGIGRHRAETATEVTARWAAEGRVDPVTAAAFAKLAQAAAFGGPLPDHAGADAEGLADRLIHDLRGSVDRQQRLLAPLREPVAQLTAATRRVARRF